MKPITDTKLLILLSSVIFFSAILSLGVVRGAEYLTLKSHAQEIAVHWSDAIAEMEAGASYEGTTHLEGLSQHDPAMETALITSAVAELNVFDREGKALIQWSKADSATDGTYKSHHHSLWEHLNPFHTKNGQKILIAAEAPLYSGGQYIGDIKTLVDLTGEEREIGEIGNLAFIGTLGILGFISLVGGILVARNSRYRREQAAELATAKENAEQANRSKSDFLANVSHELRSPLNAINGFSEIMANEMFGPLGVAKYQEYSEDIHKSGEHLLSLINDILDLSKAESGHMDLWEEAVDIPDLTSRIERLVVERAEKAKIVFRMEIADPFPVIMADRRKLLQISLNLITNAIKFTPPGGNVTFQAKYIPGEGARFIVRDTGIGVAPEDIAKVLEPFGQVADPRVRHQEGTGLGLPLSKRMVEMHGGSFKFASEKNVGTVVTITLPEHGNSTT